MMKLFVSIAAVMAFGAVSLDAANATVTGQTAVDYEDIERRCEVGNDDGPQVQLAAIADGRLTPAERRTVIRFAEDTYCALDDPPTLPYEPVQPYTVERQDGNITVRWRVDNAPPHRPN